jgi:cysteine desulfurase/selenocysteine lyase
MTAIARPPALDVTRLRQDFPILSQRVNGQPLVYLDNAATTQKPRQVIDALVAYYETSNANVHRGIHTLSMRASAQYDHSREKTARFIGARSSREIVFTRNTTESINLVARTWGEANLREGDEILVTAMEHHSNVVPWQILAAKTGARLRWTPLLPDGTLDLDAFRSLVGTRTRLVAVAHASNVLGTINPISDITESAHAAGALVLVDGAQGAPHLPLDVQHLGCDFYAFSAHKMLGPTGVGVLWAREELLRAMDPFVGGGGMIQRVDQDASTWADIPERFEGGTPNIADVIAFGGALDYLEALSMDAVRRHEVEVTGYALEQLSRVPGLSVHGPASAEARSAVVSFSLEGIHPHDVATVLDSVGIAIRAGHHCAQPLMRALDIGATCRASFYVYNTGAEVDALVEALHLARRTFS